jgi:hypothetical protein
MKMRTPTDCSAKDIGPRRDRPADELTTFPERARLIQCVLALAGGRVSHPPKPNPLSTTRIERAVRVIRIV